MPASCMLLDAYNVLFRQKELLQSKKSESQRKHFLHQIHSQQPALADKIHLIFDGNPPPNFIQTPPHPAVKLHFTGQHGSADGWIEKHIDTSSDPSQFCVVTSDHNILDHAASRGCQTMSSRSFIEKLQHATQTTKTTLKNKKTTSPKFRLGDLFPNNE